MPNCVVHRRLHPVYQLHYIGGASSACTTGIDDEVRVHVADLHASHGCTLQPGRLNQASGVVARGVHERAAQACFDRLCSPPMGKILIGPVAQNLGVVVDETKARIQDHRVEAGLQRTQSL